MLLLVEIFQGIAHEPKYRLDYVSYKQVVILAKKKDIQGTGFLLKKPISNTASGWGRFNLARLDCQISDSRSANISKANKCNIRIVLYHMEHNEHLRVDMSWVECIPVSGDLKSGMPADVLTP